MSGLSVRISVFQSLSPIPPPPHSSPMPFSLSSFASVICIIICQAQTASGPVSTSAPAVSLPPHSRNFTNKSLRTEPASPQTAHRLLLSLCGLGPAPGKGPCLVTGSDTACFCLSQTLNHGEPLYLPGDQQAQREPARSLCSSQPPLPWAKLGPRPKASLPGDHPHNSVTLRKLF